MHIVMDYLRLRGHSGAVHSIIHYNAICVALICTMTLLLEDVTHLALNILFCRGVVWYQMCEELINSVLIFECTHTK